MSSGQSTSMSLIDELTANQPFCAGLVLASGNNWLFTLAKPRRWQRQGDAVAIPVACVGGGQEPDETITDTAEREAREEIGCAVRLRSAPATLWIDRHDRVAIRQLSAPIAPLLFQERPHSGVPYKPGLPSGETLYVAHYLAELAGQPRPEDVPALLIVPADQIACLLQPVMVKHLTALGGHVEAREPIPAEATLVVTPGSSEWRIVTLLARAAAISGNPIDALCVAVLR